jgi:hypothetical protein
MSTQKRESRFSPATRTSRRDPRKQNSLCGTAGERRRHRRPLRGTERAGARGCESPARFARDVCAGAAGETAPHRSMYWSIWFWMATKFLQEDQPIGLLVRPQSGAELPGSPPARGCRAAASGVPASPGHPAIPFPSSHARLHSTLPYAPANVRRAERYDGQGNLYLFNAA